MLEANNELIGAYPSGWIWPNEQFDLIKCMIPFFDGLALFMPERLVKDVIDSDPYLARPLFECGYLRNIDPNSSLDKELSYRIIKLVKGFVRDKRFSLVGSERSQRTSDHFGYKENPKEVRRFLHDLQKMGLAGAISKDHLFAVHSAIFRVIVEACFWALSEKLQPSGVNLVPVGTSEYGTPIMAGYGRAVYFSQLIGDDIREVGIDLRLVPLDEVLDFGARYRTQYQAYLRGLRELAITLRNAENMGEFESVSRDRIEAIRDQANFLRKASRSEFRRRSLSVLVGLAGSVLALHAKDGEIAAALAAASTAVGLLPSPQQPSAYTYLFTLKDQSSPRPPFYWNDWR